MKFAQIIEFKTSRIDDFHANLDAWMTRPKAIASRTVPSSAGTGMPATDTC